MEKNVSFRRENIVQTLSFLINPIFGFIASFYYSLKKKKDVNVLMLSLSIALVFSYFPLMYDTSSNYYGTFFASQHGVALSDIRLYNATALFLNNLFDIQFMSVIFLYTSFIIFVWFSIFKYYRNFAKTNNLIMYMTIFSFSSIIYRNIMDLNRFYLATSIFLFLIYIVEAKKDEAHSTYSKLLILSVVLAFLIHPAVFVFPLLYILAIKKINFKFLVFLPFVSLIFGYFSDQILSILLRLPILENLQFINAAIGYMDATNKWGSGVEIRGYVLLSRMIEVALIFLIYFMGISLLKLDKNDSITKFSFLLMSIVLFFLSYYALYERYSIAFFLFSSFIVYKYIILSRQKNNLLLFLLISGFVARFFFINFIWYGTVFTSAYSDVLPDQNKKLEMAVKPIFYPTIMLLNIKNIGYSDQYIQQESLRGRDYIFEYVKNPIIKEND